MIKATLVCCDFVLIWAGMKYSRIEHCVMQLRGEKKGKPSEETHIEGLGDFCPSFPCHCHYGNMTYPVEIRGYIERSVSSRVAPLHVLQKATAL